MSEFSETSKDLKRKSTATDHDDRSTSSDKKRRKKDGKAGRPKHYPLSERQQLALLMQMTAEENNEQTTTPPAAKKTPGGSGKKDKVNKRNERGETALHIATIRGELSLIINLVKQGADVNVQDYAGWTPLHEACNHGYQDIAQFLLEAGAIVNSKGFNDDYPLHDAVLNEHVDLVELLLKHGANPLLANKQGERPLDLGDNKEIKEIMQKEILSSDDSDQNDAKTDTNEADERSGSIFGTDDTSQSSKAPSNSFSRELFKQFDAQNYKDLSSSSDSDDSDDMPLSRQRRTSSVHSSSKGGAISSTRERKVSSSGFLESKRSKSDNKRRLFSTDSSESVDSDAKLSKPLKRFSDYDSAKRSPTYDDDVLFRASSTKDDRTPTSSISSAANKSLFSSRKSSQIASSFKDDGSDVYDFSPTADDFSGENTAISLKPDHRTTSKWETSSSKHPGLYSRKVSSIFSSSNLGAKKARKSSKDSRKSATDVGGKSVLIKPVPETSEMMFDRICKHSPNDEDGGFAFDAKTKSVVFGQKSSVSSSTSPTSSVSAALTGHAESSLKKPEVKSPVLPVHVPTTASYLASVESRPLKATASTSSAEQPRKSHQAADTSKNLFTDVMEKSGGHRSFSVDNALLLSNSDDASRSSDRDGDDPWRSGTALTADHKCTSKSLLDFGREQKQLDSLSSEAKAVKKLKSEQLKDKLSKTLSDPLKKHPMKIPSKENKSALNASKKATSSKVKTPLLAARTKEAKAETKKHSLLAADAKSKISSSDKSLSQVQRKKPIEKKAKPQSSVKQEEKKAIKKPEVKLIDTDLWLGTPTEKSQSERLKKALPRSTKRVSDSLSESSRSPATVTSVSDSNSGPPSSQPVTTTGQAPLTQKTSGPPINSPTFPEAAAKSYTATANWLETSVNPPEKDPLPVSLLSETPPTSLLPPSNRSPNRFLFPSTTVSSTLDSFKSDSSPVKTDLSPVKPIALFKSDQVESVCMSAQAPIDGPPTAPPIPPTEDRTAPAGLSEPSFPNSTTEFSLSDNTNKMADDSLEQQPPETTDALTTADDDVLHVKSGENNEESELPEQEDMLRTYIRQRLADAKVEISHAEPLQNRIPMHVLLSRKKDPAVDRLNVIEERLAIQKKMFEKRKKIASVIPQAPQCYWEYMTFTGGYLLNGSRESRLSVPLLAPPPSLCQPMVELFKAHEEKRVRLRVQHAIEREKLIISCEQEIMRVHNRAARTNQNQLTPFSACAMLMDCEVYNMPRQPGDSEGGKTSIRDRFNTRMFLSWLQDVDDKFIKIKCALLARQRHEAEALHAVQKTEWILKCQELDRSQRSLKPNEINEVYVPVVNISDDFDLLPA